MVQLAFDRPVGAEADVSELEYIAALHQTAPVMRTDGTIKAEDISVFLRSRYGLVIDLDEVRDTILEGMGGSSTAEEVVDLMELAAILLIPTLLKAARQECQGETLPDAVSPPPPGLLERAVTMILEDVAGSSKPAVLTKDLMKRILIGYGEWEIAEDEALVEQMIAAADLKTLQAKSLEEQPQQSVEDGGILLTKESFAAALTRDVQLYDFENETRLASNFDDVFLTYRGTTPEDNGRSFISGREMRRQIRQSRRSQAKIKKEKQGAGASEDIGVEPEEPAPMKPMERKFTAPAIDITAGTFRSKIAFVTLWACTLFSFYLLFGSVQVKDITQVCGPETAYNYNYTAPWSKNASMIKCKSIDSVIGWIFVFFYLCLYGITFVGLTNLGNFVECKRWYMPLIAICAVLSFTQVAYLTASEDKVVAKYAVLGLSIIVMFLHFTTFLDIVVPLKLKSRYPRLQAMLQPGTLVDERDLKRASAFKLNRMVRNAMELSEMAGPDSVVASHFGNGLFHYGKAGQKYEISGGFVWTWKNVFYRGIFRDEGVWFSARLIASNMCQFFICAFILQQGLRLAKYAHDHYNINAAQETMHSTLSSVVEIAIQPSQINGLVYNMTALMTSYFSQIEALQKACAGANSSATDIFDKLCHAVDESGYIQCDTNVTMDYLCYLINDPYSLSPDQQMAFLEASGFDAMSIRVVANTTMQKAADQAFAYMYPSEQFMITIPAYVGAVFAFLTAVNLSVTYVPSVTTTILQLRSGVIPTLRDKDFNIYRVGPDTVSVLTGSLFWGCLVSSILVGGIAAAIVFFFVWQSSAYFAQKIVAIAVGVIAASVIKVLIMLTCRLSFYRAFYRSRPAAANISILALEWSNFALSAGFVLIRMVKLLIVAASSVGRVDRPFLDKAAGRIGNTELDGYPSIHMRDVLAHDAHRHPYIEQLGTMYLMKLRYAQDFGRTSGSCWRLLFIYAMMPWFHKYRIMSRPQLLPDIVAEQQDKDGADGAENHHITSEGDEIEVPASAAVPAVKEQPRLLHSEDSKDTEMMERNRRLEKHTARLEEANARMEIEIARMEAEVARLKTILNDS